MDHEHYAALWHTLLAGRNYRAIHVNRARDGRLVTVEASVTAVHGARDEVAGFVAVHRDLSERRRLEDERERLEAQLAQAQRFEALGTLAAGMAHDFGNLLGIVLGQAAGLARRPDDPAAVARSAESIRLAGEHGATLVRQVLTFARPSDASAGVVDAWSVAAEIERLLRGTLPASISVVLGPDPGEAWVRCDHTQLHQALLNLCLNARDAMPSGGTLSLAVSKVRAERVRDYCPEAGAGDFVELSVLDTGVGMTEATRRRALEPFFTTKSPGLGSGLGLAVVYGIARAHGGFVAVETAAQRGSAFRLFFPLSTAPPDVVPVAPPVTRDRTILLVEDQEMVSDVVAAWLRDAGYRVLTARDGADAVTAFHENRSSIDLVVCDLGLPGLGGREVFFILRKVDPGVRFVILSGFVDADERAELALAGVAAFLEKPCRVEDVLSVVGRVLAAGG
jgi:signal transduction histidine kinase